MIHILNLITVHELELITVHIFKILRIVLVFIYIHVFENSYVPTQIKN